MSTHSVRHLFPQLLSNGYTPIPNRDKACWLTGWSTIDVTERQARLWTRQTRWPAIGLRVEPPLIVFDYDLPNADIAKAVRAITPKVILSSLERLGSPPKTAFFLRMSEADELFREMHTRRYHFEGAVKPAFAVQAFAGGGGAAQFGAFGPHSHDEHGAVLKVYSWVNDHSPANVPLAALPEITRAEVAVHLDEVDQLLAIWPGLVVDAATTAGEGTQAHVYDLTEETVFCDAEGFEYSLEELIDEAKARAELHQGNLRVTGSFMGDPPGSARVKVWWNKREGVSLVDFKTGKTHHPIAGAQDTEVTEMFNEIFPKGVK